MRANALLVRSRFGWTYEVEGTPTEVVEGFIELGALPSPEEVQRYAQAQLDALAVDQTQITVELAPGFVPACVEGDTVTVDGDTERVLSYKISRDRSTNELEVQLELRARFLEEEQRTEQALRKMADGTMRGGAAVATPVRRDPGTANWRQPSSVVPIEYDREAYITADESKPWTFDRSGFITQIQADVPNSDDVDLEVRIDGVAVHTMSLTGVSSEQDNGLAIPFTKGQVMTVYSTDVGFDLVVTVQVA